MSALAPIANDTRIALWLGSIGGSTASSPARTNTPADCWPAFSPSNTVAEASPCWLSLPAWTATPWLAADANCNEVAARQADGFDLLGLADHVLKKSPQILKLLEELLQDATAGDPITGLKWTHRSLRKIQEALHRCGVESSPPTIARLLRRLHFSLRTNRKRLAGIRDPDRDQQFHYLTRLRRLYITLDLPVISVDTKKKEWVGNFENPGRCWRRQDRDVLDHDYPSWASGQAIPNGVYDLASKDGYVLVGTSHNTPAFMVATIRRWWLDVGHRRYPKARRLLIEADGGGATDHRKWGWKVGLQRLADEFGSIMTVTHYPAGASKWNPIEHQMFGPISANWAGEPLVSYETILKFIRTTRTETVLHCRARLDKKEYPVEHRVAPEDKARIRLKRHRIRPQLNYTIYPHGQHENC